MKCLTASALLIKYDYVAVLLHIRSELPYASFLITYRTSDTYLVIAEHLSITELRNGFHFGLNYGQRLREMNSISEVYWKINIKIELL